MKGLLPIKTLIFAGLGLFIGFNGFRQYEATQLEQPYEFNHAAHRVMSCIRCHEGAIDDIRATLPSFEICQKCHTSSPHSSPSESKTWDDAVANGGLNWKKLTSVPDNVFFSHRRHTKIGEIPCVKCHADIQDLSAPPSLPMIRIQMDLCIDCHLQKGETDDCARCHK